MKAIDKVKEKLYSILEQWQKDEISEQDFKNQLRQLCKGKGDKSYWWRFFANDTGANDWQSVGFSLMSEKNKKYLNECIAIALKEKSLIVHYS